MTRTEVAGIMAILREAYPHYYKGKTKDEAIAAVNLWTEMFAENDVNLVKAAVKAFIINDTKGFPPVIGQIKEYIYRLTEKEVMSEVEAWGYVSRAIRNSAYGAIEEFEKLPHVVQKAIGSPDRLRDWGLVDEKTLQSVISSNFMRSYTAKMKSMREYEKLPNDIKMIVSQIKSIEG